MKKFNRRNFLFKACASCLACMSVSEVVGTNNDFQNYKHKFLTDSGMSVQEVYDFAFKTWYIPAMKNLMTQVGKESFLQMLKKSSDMQYQKQTEENIDYSERTLKAWSAGIKQASENMSNKLSYEIINDDDKLFEVNYTECIWAKTFREANAAEIGYAGVCYKDYGMTKAFNPNLKLIRDKTQMQGDDCCHFKWTIS